MLAKFPKLDQPMLKQGGLSEERKDPMSENQISPISRVETDPGSRITQAEYVFTQPAENRPAAVKDPATTRPKAEAKVDKNPDEKPANPQSNFSLKFKIDAKTNDVTILILDRASRRVVRSIPPEEMRSLTPGELLEMFT